GQAYGVEDAEAMRRLVDSTNFGKFEIASFAASVAWAAEAGDVTARTILTHAGHDLADQATAIIQRLGMQESEFPVCTVGSVFHPGPWGPNPSPRATPRRPPRAQFRPPLHPPEVGAAILALRRIQEGDLGSWTLGTGNRHIVRSLPIEAAAPA